MKCTAINGASFLAIQITAWRREDTGLYGLWHPLARIHQQRQYTQPVGLSTH